MRWTREAGLASRVVPVTLYELERASERYACAEGPLERNLQNRFTKTRRPLQNRTALGSKVSSNAGHEMHFASHGKHMLA